MTGHMGISFSIYTGLSMNIFGLVTKFVLLLYLNVENNLINFCYDGFLSILQVILLEPS